MNIFNFPTLASKLMTNILTLLCHIVLANHIDLKGLPSYDHIVSLVENIPSEDWLYHFKVIILFHATKVLGGIQGRLLFIVL